jgi:hypothetical protein
MSHPTLNQRLRISSALVLLGLMIELLSLSWRHPISFVLFLVVGGSSMAAGILLFFYSIVVVPRHDEGA